MEYDYAHSLNRQRLTAGEIAKKLLEKSEAIRAHCLTYLDKYEIPYERNITGQEAAELLIQHWSQKLMAHGIEFDSRETYDKVKYGNREYLDYAFWQANKNGLA